MKKAYSDNTRRITAAIMVIMVIFITLFSAFYIIMEANHECTGHDCPICVLIAQCEIALHQNGDGMSLQIYECISVFFILISTILYELFFRQETPVTMKVRMDN